MHKYTYSKRGSNWQLLAAPRYCARSGAQVPRAHPTVRMPIARAMDATTGAAPLPVPPPMPALQGGREGSIAEFVAQLKHPTAQRACTASLARSQLVKQSDASCAPIAAATHRHEHHVRPGKGSLQLRAALIGRFLRAEECRAVR